MHLPHDEMTKSGLATLEKARVIDHRSDEENANGAAQFKS